MISGNGNFGFSENKTFDKDMSKTNIVLTHGITCIDYVYTWLHVATCASIKASPSTWPRGGALVGPGGAAQAVCSSCN